MAQEKVNATLDGTTISIIVYVNGAPVCIIDNKLGSDGSWEHDIFIEHPVEAVPVADALADAATAVRFADWKSARGAAQAGDIPF